MSIDPVGLDPAGPHFDGYDIMIGLNPGVAKYVDAIHTDGYGLAAYYGTLRPLAKADFYPNEGWYQPGCWTYYSKDTVRKMKGRIQHMLDMTFSSLNLSGIRC